MAPALQLKPALAAQISLEFLRQGRGNLKGIIHDAVVGDSRTSNLNRESPPAVELFSGRLIGWAGNTLGRDSWIDRFGKA